jgi:RNA polymerase sigma-70 factor, ECF subfamily
MDSTAAIESSDEELVRRYQQTSGRPYLDALLKRHIGRVRSLAYGMVLNHSDADDLTQEVFLRVTKSLAQFKGKSKFSTWLYRVTVNTSTRFLERRGHLPGEIEEGGAEPSERETLGPEHRVLSSETAQAVADALATLTPPLRAAMVLVVLEGVSVEEAAEVEGCKASTIYWRLHEGRRILKQRLANHLLP